jgi:hypothetical protein
MKAQSEIIGIALLFFNLDTTYVGKRKGKVFPLQA